MTRILLSIKSRFTTAALVFSFSGSLHAQLAKKEVNLGNDPAYIKKTALEIDKRMGAGFQRAKVAPITPADESKWLRRVYLDSVGRIPSYDEAKAFLDDKAADKRAGGRTRPPEESEFDDL